MIQQYCDWYTGGPLMGGLLYVVQRGGAWAGLEHYNLPVSMKG